jgi:AcrR family transcriptional regulator
MHTDHLSRKDREKQTKRQDILNAARLVFAEKGLHAATLDEIAEKAEFAKGTLYLYFTNKDDLFISVLVEEIIKFQNNLQAVLGMNIQASEKIRQLVQSMLVSFDQNVDFIMLMTKERPGMVATRVDERLLQQFHGLIELMASLIKSGIKDGEFAKVDPRSAALALFNLVHGSAMNSYWQKKHINSQEEERFITNLFLNGINK